MSSYDSIAPFYDQIHGNRRATIKFIKHLIKQEQPRARTILSVGCGTGTICSALARHYEITGTDISEGMLEEARKKLPKTLFYQQNMTQLSLGKTYDVVLCLFGVINHLLTFEEWKTFFLRVRDHLNPGGVFIVDILTELCLYNLILNSPLIVRDKKFAVICHIGLGENDEIQWDVKGYKIKKQRETLLFDSIIRQISFDYVRIADALKDVFSEVTLLDPEHNEVTENSELLFFVCRP